MLVLCFLAFYDTAIFEARTPRFLNISPRLTFSSFYGLKKKKNSSSLDFQSLYFLSSKLSSQKKKFHFPLVSQVSICFFSPHAIDAAFTKVTKGLLHVPSPKDTFSVISLQQLPFPSIISLKCPQILA